MSRESQDVFNFRILFDNLFNFYVHSYDSYIKCFLVIFYDDLWLCFWISTVTYWFLDRLLLFTNFATFYLNTPWVLSFLTDYSLFLMENQRCTNYCIATFEYGRDSIWYTIVVYYAISDDCFTITTMYTVLPIVFLFTSKHHTRIFI